MIRRSAVQRGDLLRVLSRYPESDHVAAAKALGFEWRDETSKISTDSEPQPLSGISKPALTDPVVVAPPVTRQHSQVTYLVPTYAESWPREEGKVTWLQVAEPFSEAELSAKGEPLPAAPPLQPWSRLWPYLRRVLGCRRFGGAVDDREWTRRAAALLPLHFVPRRRVAAWADEVCLVVDRRPALTPFWADAEELVKQLGRFRGRQGLRGWWLPEGSPVGSAYPFGRTSLAPPTVVHGAVVLVLGDLGSLSRDSRLASQWAEWGRLLRKSGHRCHALLPCPPERWKSSAVAVWRAATWDRGYRLGRNHRQLVSEGLPGGGNGLIDGLQQLLALTSPAVRVEPALLRSLRWLLDARVADAGTEFDAWNDSDSVATPLAMALHADAAVRRREVFKILSPSLKTAVHRLLEAFHAGHSPVVLAREGLNLSECGTPVPQDEVQAATETIRRMAATAFHRVRDRQLDDDPLGVFAWIDRELPRVSLSARATEEVGTLWALRRVWRGDSQAEQLPGIDPNTVSKVEELVVGGSGQAGMWEVQQAGHDLILRPWRAEAWLGSPNRIAIGAPVARIFARQPRFNLTVGEMDGTVRSFSVLPSREGESRYPVGQALWVTLESDSGRLEIEAMPRPTWATRFGRDSHGIFAEFPVDKVSFRLRWISPGSFWMGSPKEELGRYTDERLHPVTLTRGFWLADAPCTQEQWKAVMRNNPSHFKGSELPVENVTWQDCVQFCARLEGLVPDLGPRLPSEAEWEYACRAGTLSAFNDGSACTLPEGLDPALEWLGWFGKNSGSETHAVRTKHPNAWGLYDMHGNVWEWCQDGQRAFNGEPATDPLGPNDPEAWRVVRGGSYWDDARSCRSAFRVTNSPRNPDNKDLGFRLAADQPGWSAAPALKDGAEGRSPTARAGRGAGRTKSTLRPSWALARWERDRWGWVAEFELDKVAFRFRWIEPGSFLMGSPEGELGRYTNEKLHRVTLTVGFWLADAPCTQEQWVAVMQDNPSHFQGSEFPVENVTWQDCVRFCARLEGLVPGLGPRLPSEAEWEYACRAGTLSAFNDGSACTLPEGLDPALERLGWFDKNSGFKTHAVRTKQPNAWGLYDMHGNVREWCHDGQRAFNGEPATDPLGPNDAKAWRVVRGGSCWSVAWNCRSAYRATDSPDLRYDTLGFRLVAGQPQSGVPSIT